MSRYLFTLALALDQLLNALLGGSEDTTLSTRAYAQSRPGMPQAKRWTVVRLVINGLFFWQKDHCQSSYKWELAKTERWVAKHRDLQAGR